MINHGSSERKVGECRCNSAIFTAYDFGIIHYSMWGFSPLAAFHSYIVCEISRTKYLSKEIITWDDNKQVKIALILYSFVGELPLSDLRSYLDCTD